MKRTMSIALLLAACPLVGFAQGGAPQAASQLTAAPAANPVSDTLRQLVTRYTKNMVGAAQAMPPDKYDYKPTPGQISFGQLVAHIAQSNMGLSSRISGAPAPQQTPVTATDGKDKLVAAIHASFDYCTEVLTKADDTNLGAPVSANGRGGTKAATMITLACDWYDHYSAQAAYLRLNGILPPSAQPRQ